MLATMNSKQPTNFDSLHLHLIYQESFDPMTQFDEWYQQAALSREIAHADTVNLATVSPAGQPSNRMVTMKEYDCDGFVFFTDPSSHKGRDLEDNPKVALCFFWEPLNRQIRIEGRAGFVSCEEADFYFSQQPREQQIRAWVSDQSTALDSLSQLKSEVLRITKEFGSLHIPRPPSWTGYKIRPHSIEFMERHKFGIDSREIYHMTANHGWAKEKLCP